MAKNNTSAITGPLGTNSVFDFSGSVQQAPSVSNFNTLTANIRELAENKDIDSSDEFAARAGANLRTFENESQQQLDFIEEDNDFSLNQITGNQGALSRLRNRQADTLNDVFSTGAGIVASRERKKLEKERREELKDSSEIELRLQAAKLGVTDVSGMSRKDLINAIGKSAREEILFERSTDPDNDSFSPIDLTDTLNSTFETTGTTVSEKFPSLTEDDKSRIDRLGFNDEVTDSNAATISEILNQDNSNTVPDDVLDYLEFINTPIN